MKIKRPATKVNRRKVFKYRKSYNRRFTQGFAVFDLGVCKVTYGETPKVNRRKVFKYRKSYNRRFTQGFAVFDLGFVKLLTAKHLSRHKDRAADILQDGICHLRCTGMPPDILSAAAAGDGPLDGLLHRIGF